MPNVKLYGWEFKEDFQYFWQLYREMQLADRLKSMSEEEAILLLNQHGMLVKRPFLLASNFGLLGFKEIEWSKNIENLSQF